MELAEHYQKVYVSMGSHRDSFTRGFTYAFGGPPFMGQWWYTGVWTWLKALPADQRPTRAAMLSMNNQDGAALAEGTFEGLHDLGIVVALAETYAEPLQDATPLIRKAQASGADILITNSSFEDGVLARRAMKALHYEPKFHLHALGVNSTEWAVQLGKDGDKVLTGAAITEKILFDTMADVYADFQARYNFKGVGTRYQRQQLIPPFYLMGYAWAQTLQKGVEGAGTLDQQAVRDYLKSGHRIKTIAGTLRFDARGLPAPYGYAIQVVDGTPELLLGVTHIYAGTTAGPRS